MRVVRLAAEDDFEGWRAAARSLARDGVPAAEVVWQVGDRPADLFADEPVAEVEDGGAPLRVAKDFVAIASRAVLHSDPHRFGLLYALLLRVLDEPWLLKDHADRQLRKVEDLDRTVRRAIHKMRAFVRFREVGEGDARRFVAWFEPEHHIVRANAAFFVGRFANMRWSILTPRGSLHWDGEALAEGPPAHRGDAPGGDPVEAVWKAYYAAIFNPARLKPGAMIREMPRKYWKNMPETALMRSLIAGARKREVEMIDEARAAPARPDGPATIDLLRQEARSCRRCPLWKPATQAVFGEGPRDADMMIVGEQPGDSEDLAGRPFVGPAGRVLDRALAAAGIDRTRVYLTNAVKHFKFEPRGKRRIHKRPGTQEIEACRWWVDQERAIVRPKLVVAMGATAARSLTGRAVTIGRERGSAMALPDGTALRITVHPSYLLRLPDTADHDTEFAHFVADLREASRSVGV